MDLQLMQTHVENNSALAFGLYDIKEDRSNLSAFFCADVVGNRQFAQNYGGYPRSDIAEINAQASLVEAQNLLRDLAVFEPENPNSGLSDVEIMLGHKSKYMQTPSELTSYIEGQLQIRDAKRAAAQSKNDNVIDFTEPDNIPDNE